MLVSFATGLCSHSGRLLTIGVLSFYINLRGIDDLLNFISGPSCYYQGSLSISPFQTFDVLNVIKCLNLKINISCLEKAPEHFRRHVIPQNGNAERVAAQLP